MGDMRTKAQVAEVLSAYHPFWLRLGLEVVVGKAVPKGATSRADLEAFARGHFLGDADLALQRAGNRATGALHSADYWVTHPVTRPSYNACSFLCNMHDGNHVMLAYTAT